MPRISYFKFMLVAGLIFGICFGAGAGLTALVQRSSAEVPEPEQKEEEVMARQDGERTNILVLGVDARPGEKHSRSDTMILVSVDPHLDKAAIVSIPRDTRVKVKGSPNEKICTANYVGGPEYSVSLVEDLIGTKIDYYVQMDFKGFEKIIDTLGGVSIAVPQRMYKPYEGIDLHPGTQKLNGHDALGFVRFRDYAMGDIERTQQQQVFLKALAGEVLQPKTITKLPRIIKQLNKYVDTNLKLTDMLRMASWAPGFNSDSIITQTLPGYFYNEHDNEGNLIQSYWIADRDEAVKLIDNMFAGKAVAVIQSSPYPSNPPRAKVQDANEADKENQEQADDDIDQDRDQNQDSHTGPQNESNHDKSGSDGPQPGLPSPGHDDPATEMDATGPEGYI
ncbi:LCP family protein [Syntrophomonas erecta]